MIKSSCNLIIIILLFAQSFHSQYLIVDKDSISVSDFQETYKHNLEKLGINKTLKNAKDFLLLRQWALDKKVDTLNFFKHEMTKEKKRLKEIFYYPAQILSEVTAQYIKDNQTERNVLIFLKEKKEGDKNNYRQIYKEVTSGKLGMEKAIEQYTGRKSKTYYIKPGLLEPEIDQDIIKAKKGDFSRLVETPSHVMFAKLIDTRPSLGYIIFGALSFKKNKEGEERKKAICKDLASGKSFREVAAKHGSTENEKNNGGVIMGSPTLPEKAYKVLAGKKAGEYTSPVLINDHYYIFNVYQLFPYEVSSDHRTNLFRNEMLNTNYAEKLEARLLEEIKNSDSYTESRALGNIKSSYKRFKSFRNLNKILVKYGTVSLSYKTLKKQIEERYVNLAELQNWPLPINLEIDDFILRSYDENLEKHPEIKRKLEERKNALLSEYIYSVYIKGELKRRPEKFTEYYNKNKEKYFFRKRASGRAAILREGKTKNYIEKKIRNKENWDHLKEEYYGKLNNEGDILVHFREGEMFEDADIFVKNKIPFRKGVYHTKIDDRDMVIAIDDILPPRMMKEEEVHDLIKNHVTEMLVHDLIEEQSAKTKIQMQNGFIEKLEERFNK
ncbi:MAG: hypothetical protein FDW93_06575 [Bergeyella sp.]|nr:hypothetical protein [Bergeyella sp.]